MSSQESSDSEVDNRCDLGCPLSEEEKGIVELNRSWGLEEYEPNIVKYLLDFNESEYRFYRRFRRRDCILYDHSRDD